MSDETNKSNEKEDGYESICYICRRPESKTGKMMHLPNNISICADCMQKTFDSMNNGTMPGMGGMPGFDFMSFSPFMFGGNDIPQSQKVKKKQPKEKKQEEVPEGLLDIRRLKAPHRIKAELDEYVIGQEHSKKVI